jgi:hypothetical protein
VPQTGGLVETSLIYQAMMIEIDLFEEAEGTRLANSYIDVGHWRAMPEAERPEDFLTLSEEVDQWRRDLPRQVSGLRSEARSMVAAALADLAGDGPVTADTIASLDLQNPDLHLNFQPHQSERW